MISVAGISPALAETTLRIAPTQDLRVLDPTWATASATESYARFVYETLFSVDASGKPQPQMVETYSISDDQLVYEFTLRDGLKFHDGQPVTTNDVIASLKRWATRAPDGRILGERLDAMEAVNEKTFRIKLKQPFGIMLDSLSNYAGILPVIMRESDASQDMKDPIQNSIGSGPFIFEREKWVPGASWSYRKNPDYVPRSEPSDGLAGGKIVNVDRVEATYLPDASTAANALMAGEIDVVETVPYDLLPIIEGSGEGVLEVLDPTGFQAMVRTNTLHPPFNNEKARQALLYLIDSKDMLTAMVGDPKYAYECISAFVCGEAYPTPFPEKTPDLEKARSLMKEAGYNGETVVLLSPTDLPEVDRLNEVVAERLRQIGVAVDKQDMDFGTLATRRTNKDDPAVGKGGWSLFSTWREATSNMNPIKNVALATTCDQKNWFGWPCDEQIEKLRADYLDANSASERAAVMQAINDRFFVSVPYVTVGYFIRPVALRKNVTNLLRAPVIAYWSISKTE